MHDVTFKEHEAFLQALLYHNLLSRHTVVCHADQEVDMSHHRKNNNAVFIHTYIASYCYGNSAVHI